MLTEVSKVVPWPRAVEALNLKFQQLIEKTAKPTFIENRHKYRKFSNNYVGYESSRVINNTKDIPPMLMECLAEKLFGPQENYDSCFLEWDRFFKVTF